MRVRPPLCPGRQLMGLSHLAAILWMVLAVVPGLAQAAGIDCAKAKTAVEKTICADPKLREADAAVAEAFAEALAASPDAAAVRADQRAWLSVRNACPDAVCLGQRLAERRAALAAANVAAVKALWDKRAALQERLGWPKDCEASFRDTFAASPDGSGLPLRNAGVESHDLGGGRTLYLVQCDQAAYQGVYAALETGPGDGPAKLLRFPMADADGGRIIRREDDSLVGDVQFREADKTLTVLTKARGVGDCGSYAVYGFDAAGQPAARELRARECPKKAGPYLPPERWPLAGR